MCSAACTSMYEGPPAIAVSRFIVPHAGASRKCFLVQATHSAIADVTPLPTSSPPLVRNSMSACSSARRRIAGLVDLMVIFCGLYIGSLHAPPLTLGRAVLLQRGMRQLLRSAELYLSTATAGLLLILASLVQGSELKWKNP